MFDPNEELERLGFSPEACNKLLEKPQLKCVVIDGERIEIDALDAEYLGL